MPYELRILNGLHRGAVLPLYEERISIGASEDADVVLVDPGMAECHAWITRSGDGWLISPGDGDLATADGDAPEGGILLESGMCVRIGPVWVCVSPEENAWQAPPAGNPEGTRRMGDNYSEGDGEHVGGAVDKARGRKTIRHSRRALALALALVLAAVTAAAAYAFAVKPSQHDDGDNAIAEITKTLPAQAKIQHVAPEMETGALPDAASAELRKAFRRKLEDADLLRRVDLKLDDHSWSIRVDLDDNEAARFERILKAFVAARRVTFPIEVKVVSAEGMLPFKISQVISGASAGIVTADGDRLYVGDELNGTRLVSVAGNRLVFAGKHKIEIQW